MKPGIITLSYPSLVSTMDLTPIPHVSDDPMVSDHLGETEHPEHVCGKSSEALHWRPSQYLQVFSDSPQKPFLSSLHLAESGSRRQGG